jgi:DNA transposition AAA+ family ATPase
MASKPQERAIDIDVDAVRAELVRFKAQNDFSYSQLASRIGIPAGTLSSFAIGKYAGDNEKVADQVAKWFVAEAEQAAMRVSTMLEPPTFQHTRAAAEVINLLRWARRGKIAVVATSPGYGKTSALRQFAADTPQVWVATMAPSTGGVSTMLTEILDSMGERDIKGSPQMLARRIRDRVRGTGGLIALDDAQHLSEKALDELRGIHDVTGVGVALLGNAGLLQRLEGGNRSVSFAQLFSRISLRIVKTLAYPEDGLQLGRAWGIEDERCLKWLADQTPRPGGLRSISMTIELASVLANADGEPLALRHLQDAWAQLTHRPHAA